MTSMDQNSEGGGDSTCSQGDFLASLTVSQGPRGNEDDRAVWPQMARIISECRATWVLGENVPGIVTLALDGVLADLEGMGYSCQTFLVPACGKGAPHRRDRIWIVGHSKHHGQPASQGSCGLQHKPKEPKGQNKVRESQGTSDAPTNVAHSSGVRRFQNEAGGNAGTLGGRKKKTCGKRGEQTVASHGGSENVAHSICNPKGGPYRERCRGSESERNDPNLCKGGKMGGNATNCSEVKPRGGGNPGPHLGDLADGLPPELVDHPGWDQEPNIPRVSTGVKDRKHKLMALGNAIVPQVAHEFIRLMT